MLSVLGLLPASATTPMSWDEAYAGATSLVANMTLEEKAAMMLGIGWTAGTLDKWWYVGNTPAITRLNIPSLNMQDAAGGFRTYWTELVGTVTCWPSLLSMAATWDTKIMNNFAQALGAEFSAKGANVILGPSINVHRVARGGRNFEYLSGEDPYLGARLTEQYVEGVQSKGVMSVMKHFVFNNQETNRNSESSVVDDKTAWELYYPPFEAAVNAGASAAMCSYNQADGHYACENDQRLQRDLKQAMGFRGFVQSDWGATHTASVSEGLDMEMPMAPDWAATPDKYWFSPGRLAKLNVTVLDEAVTRVLAAMKRLKLFGANKCSPPNCQPFLSKNVTSDAHAALARDAATASIVMLKNHGVLPLKAPAVTKIAIIGAASNTTAYNPTSDQGHGSWNTGDYYSGGGSGHVTAGYVISPLAGLTKRARAAGIDVVVSATDDVQAGLDAAAAADVTIVVGGTTSGEALDRASLQLDGKQDDLIGRVAAVSKKTVVLMATPGAVLTPWRDQVSAALVLFLGGQESGNAWASVLFGDVSPTGKLPVTFPVSEADTIAPNPAPSVVYAEGLATGYRNKTAAAAFAFGHGLSYSTFSYGAPASYACDGYALCVDADVTNTGGVQAATVAQVYVDLGPAAAHPAPPLKGFVKTDLLQPGQKAKVTFHLTPRDVSYYDAKAGKWVQAAVARVLLGASAVDIKGETSFALQRAVEEA